MIKKPRVLSPAFPGNRGVELSLSLGIWRTNTQWEILYCSLPGNSHHYFIHLCPGLITLWLKLLCYFFFGILSLRQHGKVHELQNYKGLRILFSSSIYLMVFQLFIAENTNHLMKVQFGQGLAGTVCLCST